MSTSASVLRVWRSAVMIWAIWRTTTGPPGRVTAWLSTRTGVPPTSAVRMSWPVVASAALTLELTGRPLGSGRPPMAAPFGPTTMAYVPEPGPWNAIAPPPAVPSTIPVSIRPRVTTAARSRRVATLPCSIAVATIV